MKDSGRVRNPSGRTLALIETLICCQTTDIPIPSTVKISSIRIYAKYSSDLFLQKICFTTNEWPDFNSTNVTASVLFVSIIAKYTRTKLSLRDCQYDIILGKKIMAPEKMNKVNLLHALIEITSFTIIFTFPSSVLPIPTRIRVLEDSRKSMQKIR